MNQPVSRKLLGASLFLFLLLPAAAAMAQPVQNPANGHYYEVVTPAGAVTWQQAADAAAASSHMGLNGHLATITSQQENDFLVSDLAIPQDAWIGGFQPPGTGEPNSGWQWITGETFSFTSWAAGEPNNSGGDEDCIQWWEVDGEWNDQTCTEAFDTYVVEYDDLGSLARIRVSKDFSDDNTAEVEVTLSCNTGLPLQQTTTISEGDPVNFVVGDFEPGTLDCEVTEVVPAGYTASYDDGSVSPDNCSGEGLFGGQYSCEITNTLDAVEVEVSKVWIDENPQFAAQNVADADWSCSNVASGSSSGFLQFFGNPGSDSFFVFPDWESGTTCSIDEVALNESGVEVDDSDCQGLVVFPGAGASCTIVNTRLFEGIPTLSQYGLGLLALLMLGVGFVAYRRFI